MDELTVFDPRGRVDAEQMALAPRAAALKGLRLGILDNTNGTPTGCCARPPRCSEPGTASPRSATTRRRAFPNRPTLR
jgi:hypothetical protein